MNASQPSFRMRRLMRIGAALLLVILGYALGSGSEAPAPSIAPSSSASAATTWTCSMHPHIRLPQPGKCPICHMDLIPVTSDEAPAGDRMLKMSPESVALLGIETTPVERRAAQAEVRLVGKVAVDETRRRLMSAYVAGRIEKLFVDYAGVAVRQGDHLFTLWSPDLLVAQQEWIQADRAARAPGGEGEQHTLEAARDRLLAWGLTSEQLTELAHRGTPTERVTIHSPMDGVVLEKSRTEGAYVATGDPIYTLADLASVWVLFEAYESDLVWLRYGQDAAFTVEALPGREFHGRIHFIDPVLDPATRTAKVRLSVPNHDGRLKPGYFAHAVVRPDIGAGGEVVDGRLQDRWICPMHPEIVSERPGACPMCGMPLVSAESLGYASGKQGAQPPLVVPATAPLLTGQRAVVYVMTATDPQPVFEGREIVLGPRAGNDYLVESGLAEGERVVVHGAFKIDSALQIQAKRSLMSGFQPRSGDNPPVEARIGVPLEQLLAAYWTLQEALAEDDSTGAAAAWRKLQQASDRAARLAEDPGGWEEAVRDLHQRTATAAEGIAELRERFGAVSDAVIRLDHDWGPVGSEHHLAFCPMANGGKGGYWLQRGTAVRNPYYGAEMLECGAIKESYGSAR